jgi:hypothetical protein
LRHKVRFSCFIPLSHIHILSLYYSYRVHEGLRRERSLSADDIGSWEGDINDSPSSSAGVPLQQPLTQFTPPDPAPRRGDGGRPPVEGLSFRHDSEGVLPSPPPSADRSQLSTYDYGSRQVASPQASHYDGSHHGSRQAASPQASHYDGSHHRSRQLASPQASHYDGSQYDGSHHRHGSHYRQDSPPAHHGNPRARRISTNSFDPRQQRPSPPPRHRRPPPLPPPSFQHTPANGYARRSFDFNRSSGRPHDHREVTRPPQQQYHHHESHERRQQRDIASNRPQQPSNYYSSTASASSYRQEPPQQQYENNYHTSTSNRRHSSGDSYSSRHSYDARNGGY